MADEMNRKALNEDDSAGEMDRKARFARKGQDEDEGSEVEGHMRVNYGTERKYEPVERKA